MTVYAPLNASHFSQILSIGTQVFREDDVSVLGDALHTACVPSSVMLAPDGSVAAFAVFCQGSPLSTRISSYHSHYAPLFVQIGEVLGATSSLYELAFLAVHPRHQGAGLGSKLLQHCLGGLKTQNGEPAPAWLVVDADNVAAQRLYERHGFAELLFPEEQGLPFGSKEPKGSPSSPPFSEPPIRPS
jgi:ribosomal protein S18 acetylase RimI-like enzyme